MNKSSISNFSSIILFSAFLIQSCSSASIKEDSDGNVGSEPQFMTETSEKKCGNDVEVSTKNENLSLSIFADSISSKSGAESCYVYSNGKKLIRRYFFLGVELPTCLNFYQGLS